ncbi:MAG: conjugative transposon protein TraJ [Chryseobacterium sp.]|nr:MAG: conjugative transposon protein TraJ [Chryseobacterium sp.]
MKKYLRIAIVAMLGMIMPVISQAQTGGIADDIRGLHSVLDNLYNEMMPMCSQLIGVGRAIAGFAALWYIAYRVWGHLSRAEPIDFYPLFRPFVLGFAIIIFPSVISMINSVMQPTVKGTEAMVDNSNKAVELLLKQKEEAIKETDVWQMYVGETGRGDRDKWYKYANPDKNVSDERWYQKIGNDIRFAFAKAGYNFRNAIKEVIAEILQLLFAAVALCINTMRTFNLIILAILGPLVFGLSVFDGFQHSLRHWLSRYLNVFLWLPICNIFGAVIGKIQENMLKIDLGQIAEQGDTFFTRTDLAYMVFLIIGIYGYTTVPSIANYIVFVSSGDALTGKVSRTFGNAAGSVAGTGAAVGMAAGQRSLDGLGNLANAPGDIYQGSQQQSSGSGAGAAAGRAYGKATSYLKDKLSGKS